MDTFHKATEILPRLVIIGAGFGGLPLARKLCKAPLHITLIDQKNHHLFQPLLYQVATAFLSPFDIAVPLRNLFRNQKNVTFVMDKVVKIKPAERLVKTTLHTFPYDYLVVAPGSTQSYFAHPDWRVHAPGLKSLHDAETIREKILRSLEQAEQTSDPIEQHRLLTYVVIGGGATGVETAGALANMLRDILRKEYQRIPSHMIKIILLEAGERILPAFPLRLSLYAHRSLEELAVDIRLNSTIQHVLPGAVEVNEHKILAATILWCAGVKSVPVGEWLGLTAGKDGRIAVQADLSLRAYPEIFVIGDAAYVTDKNNVPLPGLAAVAKQQGNFVAKTLTHRLAGHRTPREFRYKNLGTLAVISKFNAIADFGFLTLRGFVGWVIWGLVHIYYLISFRNRLSVAVNWMIAYLLGRLGNALIIESQNEKNSSQDNQTLPS